MTNLKSLTDAEIAEAIAALEQKCGSSGLLPEDEADILQAFRDLQWCRRELLEFARRIDEEMACATEVRDALGDLLEAAEGYFGESDWVDYEHSPIRWGTLFRKAHIALGKDIV